MSASKAPAPREPRNWWADGLYVKAGISERRAALLVIVGATAAGDKVLVEIPTHDMAFVISSSVAGRPSQNQRISSGLPISIRSPPPGGPYGRNCFVTQSMNIPGLVRSTAPPARGTAPLFPIYSAPSATA